MIGQSIADVYKTAYENDVYDRKAIHRMTREGAYDEVPKTAQSNEGICLGDVPVSCNIVSVTVEQQHLLAELDKCLSMLGDKLLPISIVQVKQNADQRKEPARAESELYSMISTNNKYIVELIYNVNALREGVQL